MTPRTLTTLVLAAAFLAAIAAANLITAHYGPAASVYTALTLVAFDLVIRDALHDRTRGARRVALTAGLVVAGGLIAYAINRDAAPIAQGSAAAFAAALTIDALVYHAARRRPWLERSTISNAIAALVDSAVFVLVAFHRALWPVIVGQTTAKIAGGTLVALALTRVAGDRRRVATA